MGPKLHVFKTKERFIKNTSTVFFCAMISKKSNSIENDDVLNHTVESDNGYIL